MSIVSGWRILFGYLSIKEILLISSTCKFFRVKSEIFINKIVKNLPWVIMVDYNATMVSSYVKIGWFNFEKEENSYWNIFEDDIMETVILRGRGGEEGDKIFKALIKGGYCHVHINENMHPIGIDIKNKKGILTKIEIGCLKSPLINNIKNNSKFIIYSDNNTSKLGKRKRQYEHSIEIFNN